MIPINNEKPWLQLEARVALENGQSPKCKFIRELEACANKNDSEIYLPLKWKLLQAMYTQVCGLSYYFFGRLDLLHDVNKYWISVL